MTFTIDTKIENIKDDDACLNYVYKILRQYRDRHAKLYNKLKERKQYLNHCFTSEMEETIDKFVEQHGTTFHRISIEEKISLVKYKHKDRLIELECYEQNPSEHQADAFQNLNKAKYENEVAKLEVAILNQRLLHNHLPNSFNLLRIPQPIDLNKIQNDIIRQSLSERYYKVLQRTKSDMMHVYIATQNVIVDQYRHKCDQINDEIKANECTGLTHRKLI